MALIACPDCSTQVSDRAPTCPKCGAPIAGRLEAEAAGAALTTVQETSKRLKVHILISSLCFWGGLIWVVVAVQDAQAGATPNPIPSLLTIAGLFWYIVTKVRIWWHHK